MQDQDEPLKKPEEVEVDDVSIEEDEELTPNTLKKIREKLRVAISEKQSYLESWQRDKAEFINLRKRDEEARDAFLLFAKERILEDLIPVVSSFEIAFSNKSLWDSVSKEWRDGVSSIYSQLQNVLLKNGLGVIEPKIGEVFDPKVHEAVLSTKTSDPKLDNTVASILQKGYLYNEKVLRPAQVAVYSIES